MENLVSVNVLKIPLLVPGFHYSQRLCGHPSLPVDMFQLESWLG